MGWSYWLLITCNIALPQFMWSRYVRRNVSLMFIMSLIVNTGMSSAVSHCRDQPLP